MSVSNALASLAAATQCDPRLLQHLAVQLLQHLMSLLVIRNVLHLLQHSRTKHNFVARISFLEFLLCRQQQEQQRQQQSRARVTKNANIFSQSCQPSAESTVASRRTQMKLAQMTLYANIFKISLLLGCFLLPPHCTHCCCSETSANKLLPPPSLTLFAALPLRSWRRLL